MGRHRRWPLAAACAVLLFGAAAAVAAAPRVGVAPRLHWQATRFDFGALYQHDRLRHAFVFRNVGKAPLRIVRVGTSCGCTAAEPPEKPVPPGGTGAIDVVFDTGTMRGRVAKTITVVTNDPVETHSELTLTGKIAVEVEVVPSGVYFGSITVGQGVERTVLLRPVDVRRFRILEVKSEHPSVWVSDPQLADPAEAPGTYRLTIRVLPQGTPLQVNTRLVLHTDLPHGAVLTIPVFGRFVHGAKPLARPSGG